VLARLVRRGMDGKGGIVTTSIAAGTVGLTPMFYGLLAAGHWHLRREANLLDGGAPFYRTYACADGFVAVGALEPKFYRELLDVTGLSGSLDAADQYRHATWSATAAVLEERFLARTREEWAAAAAGRDCCLTPVLDFAEAAAHPHVAANRWFADSAGSAREAASGSHRTGFAQPRAVIRFDAGS
jgi:alpha-methylacyl-CoA racemase